MFLKFLLIFIGLLSSISKGSEEGSRFEHFSRVIENHLIDYPFSCSQLLTAFDFPVTNGKKINETKYYLGEGAFGVVHRIFDENENRSIVVKKYHKFDEEVYHTDRLDLIANHEIFILTWLKDFFKKNEINFQVPEIHGKNFDRNNPEVNFSDTRGTNLSNFLENEEVPRDIRKYTFQKYLFSLRKVFETLMALNDENTLIWTGVDEVWEANGIARDLPYLSVYIRNVPGTVIPNKRLSFSFSLNNILVNQNGELFLIDPN